MHYDPPTYDQYFTDPRYQAVVHAEIMMRYPDYRPCMLDRNGRANNIRLIDHAPPKEYVVAYEPATEAENLRLPSHKDYFSHGSFQRAVHEDMILTYKDYRPRMLDSRGRENNVELDLWIPPQVWARGPSKTHLMPHLPMGCPMIRREPPRTPTPVETRLDYLRRFQDRVFRKPIQSFADTWGIK